MGLCQKILKDNYQKIFQKTILNYPIQYMAMIKYWYDLIDCMLKNIVQIRTNSQKGTGTKIAEEIEQF